MKNTMEGINTRLDDTEEHISDLEDRIMDITQSEEQKERQIRRKIESNVWDLWNNIKCANIWIIGVPEGEERERKGAKCIGWNHGWKLLEPEEGNRYPGPGITESPKQGEPKETRAKTYN